MDLFQALVNAGHLDGNIRSQAEAFLTNASQQNFPLFIHSLACELTNEDREPKIRQLAGIVLKNSIHSKSSERNEILIKQWASIEPNARSVIKASLLQGLGSPVYDARHTVAMVISHIGLIEIPYGMWEELIPALFKNIESGAEGLKQATLQTLGYICEEIDPNVMTKYSDNVLRVITDGIKDESLNVKLAGIQALCHALEFVKNNFEVKEQRDYIMKVIIENAESPSPAIKRSAFENLVKIATIYYPHILDYMNPIFNSTVEAIKNDKDEGVVLQAIEFWTSLAEEETAQIDDIEFNKLVIPQALTNLIPVMLSTLTKQNENQDGSWGITPAGATCISTISYLIGDRILELILPFVANNIQNQEWRLREASCTALGSVLDGTKEFGVALTQLVPILLQLIRDNNDMVKETASWTIGRICDHQMDNVSELLEQILSVLMESVSDSNLKVATHACWAIHNICQAFENGPVGRFPTLEPASQKIAQCLLSTIHRQDIDDEDHKLKTNAYEALNALISFSNAPSVLIVEILRLVMADFEKSFNMVIMNADDRETQFNLQSLLCSTFQAIASTLKEEIKPHAQQMMVYLLNVFNNQSVIIYEEALLAIGALILALEEDFEPYFSRFFPILKKFLENVDFGSVTNIAIGIVGDLARSFGKKFSGCCSEVVPLIVSDLTNPRLSMNAKPSAISCLCDIAISVGADFIPYLKVVMPILHQASLIDIDDEEFLNELRATIFQTYTGIIQGLKGDNQTDELLPYINPMLEFVVIVNNDPERFDTVTSAALALLGDLALNMGEHTKNMLNNATVKQFVQSALSKGINYSEYAETAIFKKN